MNVLINITWQGQSGNYLVNMNPGWEFDQTRLRTSAKRRSAQAECRAFRRKFQRAHLRLCDRPLPQ